MKKITLNGKMYNLIDQTEYLNNKNYYDTESNVAIEHYNMALPLTQSQFSNGVYSTENRPIIKYNVPLDKDNYMITPENTIDFTNLNSISEYYNNCVKYNEAERDIITTVNNQFKPKINEEDPSLLKIVKQTICDKNIDIDKYADRFVQFNNDKRLLSPSYKDITMKKAIEMLNNLDTDVYVITANKDSDVPNPMPEPLIRKITGNGEQLTQEELFNILKGE